MAMNSKQVAMKGRLSGVSEGRGSLAGAVVSFMAGAGDGGWPDERKPHARARDLLPGLVIPMERTLAMEHSARAIIPWRGAALGHRMVQALATVAKGRPSRSAAGVEALRPLRRCPLCHRPMRPVVMGAEEDRFTGEPVTRHAWQCAHCESGSHAAPPAG